MLFTSLLAGMIFVNAAVNMGGYIWDAPNGYHTGTVSVTGSNGSVTVEFQNIGNQDDSAGLTTVDSLREDWTEYEAMNLQFKTTLMPLLCLV